ncbi:MAG: DUF2157 domain-containing protein [Cyanobacteria bacterium J06636_16]
MASDGFRRELQREAQRWLEEGLITEDQFQKLAKLYQLDALDTAARDRFVMILLGLGSLLVGIGAITFVAANWQALSQNLKAGLLFTIMMLTNLGGFALINPDVSTNRWRRIGQALLLLGALLLGANLTLMEQITHTGSTRYELCAVWALGVLAMAYGLRLTFLGMLALLLLGIGYWSSVWDIGWLQNSLLGMWTLQGMPLVVTALFLPLAYVCRSQVLFTLSAIAATTSLLVLVIDTVGSLPAVLEAWVMVLPYALLWAYDDTLWMFIGTLMRDRLRSKSSQPETAISEAASPSMHPSTMATQSIERPFQPTARGLMVFGLSVFYWVFSFQDEWNTTSLSAGFFNSLPGQSNGIVLLTLLVISIWTVLSWAYLGWRQHQPWRLDSLSAIVLSFLGVTAGIFFWASVAGPITVLATTIFNILLAITSLGLMREGLASGARAPFWWGLVILTVQILSRVSYSITRLLLKSLVFVLCGVAVILVGLWFERYVRTLQTDSAWRQ